jgi:hypothetical protein
MLLKHVSPLSWEHINLTGIYTWDTEHQMPDGLDLFDCQHQSGGPPDRHARASLTYDFEQLLFSPHSD